MTPSMLALLAAVVLTQAPLLAAAWLAPPVLVGSWCRCFVHHRRDGPMVRILVLAFSIASGAAVMVRAL